MLYCIIGKNEANGGDSMKILAHRGYHGSQNDGGLPVENSLRAFEECVERHFDGVELDMRLTADNRVVVHHDADLSRLFGVEKRIENLPLDEIKRLSREKGAEIPTMEEVFELFRGRGMVNVEIKEEQVVPQLASVVREKGVDLDAVIFSSFIHTTLKRIKGILPPAKTGLLIGPEAKEQEDIPQYLTGLIREYEPYSLHMPVQAFDFLGKENVVAMTKRLKERFDLQIVWWTVNGIKTMKFIREASIGEIVISDKPGLLMEGR